MRVSHITSVLLAIVCATTGVTDAFAQVHTYEPVYRPADAEFRVLETPHFDIVYQEGAFEEAAHTAAILENTLPRTLELAGLPEDHRLEMPVVLSAYSDHGSGLLSTAPFRQEISRVGIRNNVFPAGISSWYNLVAPHELMHAAHAEIDAPIGVGWIMRRLAPDWARSLNLSVPAGLTEGVAVYRESEIEEGGGRLNQPLFEKHFQAAMDADDPWSLAQTMNRSPYAWPHDRYYIAGSHFFKHLYEEVDSEFFRTSTRFYNRFPFFGYGVALGVATGSWPSTLHDDLLWSTRARSNQLRSAYFSTSEVVAAKRGSRYRRPIWLDDENIISYRIGYSQRPGFYRFNLETGDHDPLSTENLTEDFWASINESRDKLYFTRYARDRWTALRRTSDVYALDINDGSTRQITQTGSMSAPFTIANEVYAFEIDGDRSHLVRIDEDGASDRLTHLPGALFRLGIHDADSDRTFAVVNIRGKQGLFELADQTDRWDIQPILLLHEGQIHDVNTVAGRDELVISSDLSGKSDIYVFDLEARSLTRLTDVNYGAIEPSVSPNASSLALVDYQHEQYRLVVTPYAPHEGDPVDEALLMSMEEMEEIAQQAEESRLTLSERFAEEETEPYRAWNYFRPRALYPTIYPADPDQYVSALADTYLGLGAGIALEGADPLQRWVYQTEGFYRANRWWGGFTVRSARYRLRPSLSIYRRPSTTTASVTGEDGSVIGRQEVGIDERGGSLTLSLPVTHSDNVFHTTSSYSLRGTFRQTQAFERDGGMLADPTLRATIQPSAAFGYRLQQNTRDLHPNTGAILSASSLVDVWTNRETESRGIQGQLSFFLPLISSVNGGVRMNAAALNQNRGVYNTRQFMPRGYERDPLGTGTFARFDVEVTQPLWFIDDGSVLIPFFVDVLYAYGFGQSLLPVDSGTGQRSSVGAGLGLRFTLFSHMRFDVRAAGVYRIEDNSVGWSWR